MKTKILLIVCVLFISGEVFSQVYGPWTDLGTVTYTNDKIGIGTQNTGESLLKVQGSLHPAFEIANSSNTLLQLGVPTSPNDFATGSILGDIVIRTKGDINGHQGIIFYNTNNDANGANYFAFGDAGNGLWMKIFNNKTVKIDGKLFAKEIEVKTNVWADFVFKSDYKLMPLNELERFIKENNHLPNIPTEAEVKTDGINVAEMNVKLLQKIEELTLYVIQLKKENEQIMESLQKFK
ncbi:MAG: hypothetical protein Q8R96_09040 [Bacteroidota bacterium]|nr:hypothetical protein [Bacteroidota bacterium]